MRTLVLSVSVGLWMGACTGSVSDAVEEAADHGAGAQGADATAPDAGDHDVDGDESRRDAGVRAPSDGGAERDAVVERDAAVGREASVSEPSAPGGGNPAASAGSADSGAAASDAGGNKGRPVFIAAGYSSAIAFSSDLGASWRTVQGPIGAAAHNDLVLSGAAFLNGTFAVVGHDIFSSTDGEHWTPRENPSDQWLGNLNAGLGLIVGLGGYGTSIWSEDGTIWHKGGMLGTDAFDTAAFGNGMFRSTSKEGQWWNSADGKTWTRLNSESGHSSEIVWCVDHFADESDCETLVTSGQTAFGENVWIHAQHNSQLRRSTNGGQTWTNVSVNFDANCVAFGYVR